MSGTVKQLSALQCWLQSTARIKYGHCLTDRCTCSNLLTEQSPCLSFPVPPYCLAACQEVCILSPWWWHLSFIQTRLVMEIPYNECLVYRKLECVSTYMSFIICYNACQKVTKTTFLPMVIFLFLCFQINFIYLAKSTKRTMLSLTLVCTVTFLLVCSGTFFPYSSNPASPKPKRVFLQVRVILCDLFEILDRKGLWYFEFHWSTVKLKTHK